VISNINLKDMMDYHRELRSTATIALVRGQRIELGVATLDGSMRVLSFEDQPELRDFVNAAVFVFEPSILKYAKEVRSIEESIVEMIRFGDRVFGYPTDAYWYHLTHPSDYARVLELVQSGKLRTDRADANRTTPRQ
jgi:NDP-sugar pyrophosphorylase family protein